MHDLGWMYKMGFGVMQDSSEAEKWYMKGEEQRLKELGDSLKWLRPLMQ